MSIESKRWFYVAAGKTTKNTNIEIAISKVAYNQNDYMAKGSSLEVIPCDN